jgi:peptidoglycan/xylan/chitin deacetylase (PgdA/CDA1 family)
MFLGLGIKGDDLPPKTVCLTFDDGPGETEGSGAGPRTLELAQFLSGRNIGATFFVIGEFASTRKDILKNVARMGHLIGNHTYNHTRLADRSGRFAADEIGATHKIISDIPQPLRCFRAPHSRWSSKVAGELNWTEASHYVGPILWDIDAADWSFWSGGRPVRNCVSAYIDKIRALGRGIIIMHDGSFEPQIRLQNNTFEAVRLLVVWLQQNGYSFVRLDSLPQVRETMRISSVISLETATGHYLSPTGSGGEVLANALGVGPSEPFGVIELGDNRIALRSLSGQYVSVLNGGGGSVLANAPDIDEWEALTRVDLGDGKIAIRCPEGQYISPQGGGGARLCATAAHIGPWEVLRVARPSRES